MATPVKLSAGRIDGAPVLKVDLGVARAQMPLDRANGLRLAASILTALGVTSAVYQDGTFAEVQ